MGLMDSAKDLLNSEKAEEVTDAVLDKAADVAKKTLGEDKADKIDAARDAADKAVGTE